MERLVSRRNLECHVADPKHSGALDSVLFTEAETVSTDGKLLMVVPYPNEDLSEFPFTSERESNCVDSVLVSAGQLAKVAKALPKNSTRPILDLAKLHGTSETGATFSVTDLDTSIDLTVRSTDARFPDYSRVMASPDTAQIHLGVAVLEKLLKALKKASATSVIFKMGSEKDAVRFEARHGESPAARDEGIHGMIMPIVKQS